MAGFSFQRLRVLLLIRGNSSPHPLPTAAVGEEVGASLPLGKAFDGICGTPLGYTWNEWVCLLKLASPKLLIERFIRLLSAAVFISLKSQVSKWRTLVSYSHSWWPSSPSHTAISQLGGDIFVLENACLQVLMIPFPTTHTMRRSWPIGSGGSGVAGSTIDLLCGTTTIWKTIFVSLNFQQPARWWAIDLDK